MTVSGKTKSRELSKQETREALIQAGIGAFSEEGVDLPSLDGICARAGFTRGAFYVHFKDRDDFVEVILERVLQDFVDSMIVGDSLADLMTTVDRFLQATKDGSVPFMGDQKLLTLVLGRSLRSSTLQTRYLEILSETIDHLTKGIKAGQDDGVVRANLDPDIIASILVASALGFASLTDVGLQIDSQRLKDNVIALLASKN